MERLGLAAMHLDNCDYSLFVEVMQEYCRWRESNVAPAGSDSIFWRLVEEYENSNGPLIGCVLVRTQ